MQRLMAMLVSVVLAGCAAPPSGGGGDGGDGDQDGGPVEVALPLGETFEFELTPTRPVRQATDIESSDLAAATTDSGRVQVQLGTDDVELSGFPQGRDCVATVDVYVDDWGADSPCDTGRFLGTLEIRISSNSVEDISGPLNLEGEKLATVMSGRFSLCMEAEVDCDGTIRIVQLTYSFEDGTGGTGGGGGGGGDSNNWTTADLAGTWEGVGHEGALVIAADGSVLSETIQGCEIPCDGERHECGTSGAGIDYAIDPYRMTVDPSGRITMGEYETRQYYGDDPNPIASFLKSGQGELESSDSMSLETFIARLGITQQWSYTKVAE